MRKSIFLVLASVLLFICWKPADSIRGYVKDQDGKAMQGVVVSDGVSVTMTDKKGYFKMPLDRASGRFVFVSTPSGYTNSSFKGETCYYQEVSHLKKEYNFVLTKNSYDDTNHKAIVFADPQIQDTLDLKPYALRVKDMAEHVALIKEQEYCVGICLGDIVGWQHALYPKIMGELEKVGIDMRMVMGNHDMTNYGRSHQTSFTNFEQFFGPMYYSFNVGNVHYVVLNDNFYVGRDYFYIGYIDETQLAWLVKDLTLVPKDKQIVLCMHIPTTVSEEDIKRFRYDIIGDNLCNKPALYALLEGRSSLILSGHMHTNSNHLIKGEQIMEHNIGGFCGGWWCGSICIDGCPPGYKVYSFGAESFEWYYKSCFFPTDHQARAYFDHADYPGLAVAHVWDYDPAWKVEYWEDGQKVCDMEQFTGKDPMAAYEFSAEMKKNYKIPWVYCEKTSNLFKAPINPSSLRHEIRITDRFGRTYILK